MAPLPRRFRVRPHRVELDASFTFPTSPQRRMRAPSPSSSPASDEGHDPKAASSAEDQRRISARSSCAEWGAGGCTEATTVSDAFGSKERSNDS